MRESSHEVGQNEDSPQDPGIFIKPRTPEEVAEDLYANQGIVSPKLPLQSRPRPIAKEPVLEDFRTRKEIEENVQAGLPASFSHIPHPDPINRRGERAPSWRGSSKSNKRP